MSIYSDIHERETDALKERIAALEARVVTSNRLELEAYRERDAALARVKALLAGEADVRREALQEAIGTVYSVCTLSDGEANMQAEIVRELSQLKEKP